MTWGEWVYVVAFVLAIVFVGIGFIAFYPDPWDGDDTPIPEEPEEVVTPADAQGRHRPRKPAEHSADTLGGGTVRLWPEGYVPPPLPRRVVLDEDGTTAWPKNMVPPRDLDREQ